MALIPRVREMLQRKEIMGQEGKTEFKDIISFLFYPLQEHLILKKSKYEEQRIVGIKEVSALPISSIRWKKVVSFSSDSVLLSMEFEYPVTIECENGRCEVK